MMFGIGTGIGRCGSAIKPDVCVANHDARGARNQMGSLLRYEHRMKKVNTFFLDSGNSLTPADWFLVEHLLGVPSPPPDMLQLAGPRAAFTVQQASRRAKSQEA